MSPAAAVLKVEIAPDEYEQLFAWLSATVEPMPEDARNPMCWRVVVRPLYESYKRSMQRAQEKWVGPKEFLDFVTGLYQRVRLSDWRVVNDGWEREFDGLMLTRVLEPVLPRRKMTFAESAAQREKSKKGRAFS